jgi:DNA polymerase-3 subunit alpha (Gram-positive type)
MLVDTKPESFSDLIRISGLSHGTDVWLNNAQDLIKSGICTLSEAICCRDDIMIYLIHKELPPKTAFKIMEDVRKGKGLKDEYVNIMKEHGVPDWYIDSCNKIKYMFPKAHAAAYVMMAFRIAWFKVYYPEAFYASFFSVRGDDFDIEFCGQGRERVLEKMKELKTCGRKLTVKEDSLMKILEVANEMYVRGIKFLNIDLYKSHPTKFLVEPEGLRPPFTAIQGLGVSAAYKIDEERAEGEFISVEELKNRTKISKTVIEQMKNLGVLNSLPETGQLTFFDC